MPPRARKATAEPAKKAAPRAKKTNAQLTAELKEAREELAMLRARGGEVTKAVDDYKARVKNAAREAQDRHGWCSEVDEILKELDIDATKPRFRFTVMVPLEIEAELKYATEDAGEEDRAKFFASCINRRVIEEALEELHQQYQDDNSALLSNDWDTNTYYEATGEYWKFRVGDNITVQDIEVVKT